MESLYADTHVLYALRAFADTFARRLFKKDASVTPEDLIAEAFRKLILSKRKWYKHRSTFLQCLYGIIRSLAWHVKNRPEEPVSGFVRRNEEGEKYNPLDEVEDLNDSALRTLIANENQKEAKAEFDRILDIFKDDQDVLNLIEGLDAELSPKEIREYFSMDLKQYDRARKRMAYKLSNFKKAD